jgi:hypothetical protein
VQQEFHEPLLVIRQVRRIGPPCGPRSHGNSSGISRDRSPPPIQDSHAPGRLLVFSPLFLQSSLGALPEPVGRSVPIPRNDALTVLMFAPLDWRGGVAGVRSPIARVVSYPGRMLNPAPIEGLRRP